MKSRRQFLKASGVTISLPFLSSLRAEGAVGWPTPPSAKRMVMVTTGLGMYPKAFFPNEFGESLTGSNSLAPMMKHKGDFTVLSNMQHPGIFSGHQAVPDFLRGIPSSKITPNERASVDQIAAESVGYDVRFPSIHAAVGGDSSGSFSSSGIGQRTEQSPESLFRKLFVNDSAAAKKKLAKEIEEQGSVLDLVRNEAKKFEKRMSAIDRDKLDEYLTAIREAEQRLQGMKKWQNTKKLEVDREILEPEELDDADEYEHDSTLMFDLYHLALMSDSSRVMTLHYGMHNKRVPLAGVNSGYHTLSHHGENKDKLKQLGIIETFYIAQVSRFIEKLKQTNMTSGNLLDETMVFFGSGLSDAGIHSNRDLPIMLSGGGLKHRGYCNTGKATEVNSLYTTMLQNFGIEIESYNQASRDLNHLFT